MRCVCKFNPRVDMSTVDQFGFVDVHEALATGNISGAISPSEVQFDSSGTFSPKSILGRATDFFEAVEMSQAVKESAARAERAAEAAKSATPSGAE